jgi:hypothetical protein
MNENRTPDGTRAALGSPDPFVARSTRRPWGETALTRHYVAGPPVQERPAQRRRIPRVPLC